MLETVHNEKTQEVLNKLDVLLSEYADSFKTKYGHFKVEQYQKAWLSDETRSAILYAKTRIVALSVPTQVLLVDDDFTHELRNFNFIIPNPVEADHVNGREHGWYNKFNKTNKRKNLATK